MLNDFFFYLSTVVTRPHTHQNQFRSPTWSLTETTSYISVGEPDTSIVTLDKSTPVSVLTDNEVRLNVELHL